jgi:hypothetical protein
MSRRGPSREEWERADFGRAPANPEGLIRKHFELVLLDPESLRLTQVTTPINAWYHPDALPNPMYGWACTGWVNAKNRFGGYVGAKPHHFFFDGDFLMSAQDISDGPHQYVGFGPK